MNNWYIYIMLITIMSFAALCIFTYMSFWFLLSLIFKRNDIADIAWGLGFVFVVDALAYKFGINNIYFLIVLIFTNLWGFRLASHIFYRNSKKKEDKRYILMSKSWGKWFYLRSYLQVFLLQGFFMLLISMSAIISNLYLPHMNVNSTSTYFVFLGVIIWFIGFLFESIGDYQLAKFLSNPKNKGKIMTSGLWNYTRHPNYFGEVTQWWGLFLVVCTLPNGLIAFLSPLTISWLILYVSGIPMTEKPYENNPEFKKYKKRTSAFFPWFPKKK